MKNNNTVKYLIYSLSKSLNVDISKLSFLEEKMNIITLGESPLKMLEIYFMLLEEEFSSLITLGITPSFQVGIKNKHFTFNGYNGTYNTNSQTPEVNENTYYSFDSISKVLTSTIVMLLVRDNIIDLDIPVSSINKNFNMNATIRSILNFTACITTDKRIDNLSREETIEVLKRCKQNLMNKDTNYYRYNDIGFMILRLSLPMFLECLDKTLEIVDKDNLTYDYIKHKNNITGGKIDAEYLTPDTKGRGILFPGHTGLYGSINGLLNLYYKIINNGILTKEELDILLKQPYSNSIITNLDRTSYMTKISGFYRMPNNIEDMFDKMKHCDFSNLTTKNALASAGTCGAWVMGDNLSYQNLFNSYVGSILTNPYTYINEGMYPNDINEVENTNLLVNRKGVIIGYPSKLNPYKEIVARYGILLELLTEYIKSTYRDFYLDNKHITYVKKLK